MGVCVCVCVCACACACAHVCVLCIMQYLNNVAVMYYVRNVKHDICFMGDHLYIAQLIGNAGSYTRLVFIHLAHSIPRHQHVSSCQVTMDEGLDCQVRHPTGHLSGVAQQSRCQFLVSDAVLGKKVVYTTGACHKQCSPLFNPMKMLVQISILHDFSKNLALELERTSCNCLAY